MTNHDLATNAIESAIHAVRTQQPPSITRTIIRQATERALDALLPNDPLNRGGFLAFLKLQAENHLFQSEGDEQNSAAFYRTNAAYCFLPVAARELVKDGLDPDDIARFCIEAAIEALATKRLPTKQQEDQLLQLVLAMRVTDENSSI